MSYEDLRAMTRRQPFTPFRVILSTGETFDVWRQDGHVLSKRHLIVGLPGETGGTDYDRTTMIDLIHIVRTEPLQLPVPPGSNGPAN